MMLWKVICQTETCVIIGLPGVIPFDTEPNYTPEIVCGACGNQYTDITILEGGN
jgi:hypothetical protein